MVTTDKDSLLDYTIVIPVYYNEGLLKGTMNSIKTNVIECNPTLYNRAV